MSRRLLFLSKAEDPPSTRYRALQFFEQLAARGIQASHLPLAGGPLAYLTALNAALHSDVVVVLRKTLPPPLLFSLRKVSRLLVFDFDDAIFCNSDGTPSTTRLSRFARMAKASDHIFAGNHFLAGTAKRFNPAVTFLPTSVNVDRYAPLTAKTITPIDLVWIGSSSTRKYLESALPAMTVAAQRIPGLRLKIIADFDLPNAGLPTLAVPWHADSEALELASAHIGIAPMVDNDWTRGKCALKVLQYFAAGLPVVSSRAGVNAEIVIPGVNGELVGSESEWVDALIHLANDPALCQRYGIAGRQMVEREYSLDVTAQRLADILNQLACSSARRLAGARHGEY